MSRSYKKTPITKSDTHGRKSSKRLSNHAIRKIELPTRQRGAFRKVYNSWDIYDYVSRWTLEEAIAEYNERCKSHYFREKYPTLEDFIKFWKKCMLYK